MNFLTEALICIAMGIFIAIAFFAAMMIEEPRTNYDNPMAEWVVLEGDGR